MLFRSEGDDGSVAVAQLQVGGAAFWIQDDPDYANFAGTIRPIRIILNVDDPDAFFKQAVEAGATEVNPVGEQHGWLTGRITDPFGHDWEFSKQVD